MYDIIITKYNHSLIPSGLAQIVLPEQYHNDATVFHKNLIFYNDICVGYVMTVKSSS